MDIDLVVDVLCDVCGVHTDDAISINDDSTNVELCPQCLARALNDFGFVAVHAKHVDGPYFLGIASGSHDDICLYFDKQKAYGLEFSKVKIVQVPSGYAKKKKALLEELENLEKKKRSLLEQIENI